MKHIGYQELINVLEYDKDSGIFTWKDISKFHITLKGKEAGTVRITRFGRKYRWIKINNIGYSAHRLAWLYIYGTLPNNIIDHKNGNALDNRIENLNLVDIFMNNQNHKVKIKKSGLPTGVRTQGNRFRAIIKANNKEHYLGSFETILEAQNAYNNARKKLHYNPQGNL